MSGIPGIVIVTAGAGVTLTVNGAMDAKFDEVPVIIFGGATATTQRGMGELHDIDHLSVMRPVCKEVFSVEKTEQMIPILRKAFQIACSDTPGPVFIQLPSDVLQPYPFHPTEIRMKTSLLEKPYEQYGIVEYVKFGYNKIWNEYILSKYDEKNDINPLPIRIPIAKPKEVSTSAKIIASSKRPLLVIGSQVTLSPNKLYKVPPALESMGIPCILTFTAKGLLGKSNNLWIQYDMEKVVGKADVIILCGMPCDYTFKYGLDLPVNSKIITVGRNRNTLTLNAPKFWSPTQIICSDVGRYLVKLSKELKKTTFVSPTNWIQICRNISQEFEDYYKMKANEKTKVHLNPIKMLFELDKIAPDNVIFVADIGDFTLTARFIMRAPRPLSYIHGGPFVSVGCGIGLAMGVKLCRPESQVWHLSGDGAAGYHITEFDTCIRHNIPIMSFVGNDAAWFEIARKEYKTYGDMTTVGVKLQYTNYQDLAIGLGAKGILLDRNNEDNIEHELQNVQKMNEDGQSVLVNVLIGTTNIRDGFA